MQLKDIKKHSMYYFVQPKGMSRFIIIIDKGRDELLIANQISLYYLPFYPEYQTIPIEKARYIFPTFDYFASNALKSYFEYTDAKEQYKRYFNCSSFIAMVTTKYNFCVDYLEWRKQRRKKL